MEIFAPAILCIWMWHKYSIKAFHLVYITLCFHYNAIYIGHKWCPRAAKHLKQVKKLTWQYLGTHSLQASCGKRWPIDMESWERYIFFIVTLWAAFLSIRFSRKRDVVSPDTDKRKLAYGYRRCCRRLLLAVLMLEVTVSNSSIYVLLQKAESGLQ